jgi:hypothetical protein
LSETPPEFADALTAQRVEYVRQIRGLHADKRVAGFVACLIGALLLIWGRMRAGAPAFALPAGVVLIAVGWALFAYVIFARTRYVRTHPFQPKP